MINSNKLLIVQRNKMFAYWLYMQAPLMLWPCLRGVVSEYNFVVTMMNLQVLQQQSIYLFISSDQKACEDVCLSYLCFCVGLIFLVLLLHLWLTSDFRQ